MMNQSYTEQDWKLFRSRIVGWQEAYMEKLNREYIVLLTAEGDASDKFRALEKRIREDKRSTGVSVEMRRSMLRMNLIALYREGVIAWADLEGFSETLLQSLNLLQREERMLE